MYSTTACSFPTQNNVPLTVLRHDTRNEVMELVLISFGGPQLLRSGWTRYRESKSVIIGFDDTVDVILCWDLLVIAILEHPIPQTRDF